MTSVIGALFGPRQRVRVALRVGESLSTLLQFDASVSENHMSELDVTEHPVERGSDITDHVRLRPNALEMTVIMSNRPIAILASQNASLGIKGGNPTERDKDAFAEMLRWQTEGLLLTIVTTLRTYENMILQRIAPTRDAANGKVLRASLSFREILTAETQIGDAPVPAAPQDKKRKNKGRQNTQAAAPEKAAAAASSTSGAASGVNSLFGVP